MLGCLLLTLYYSSPAPYSPPFPCSLLSVFQRLWVWNLHFSESQPVRFWVRFQQWKASTKSGKQRGSRAIKFPAAAIGSCMSSVNFRRKQMWLSSSFQVPLLELCPFGVAEAKNISDGFLQFLKLPGFQKTSGSFPWLLVHPPQLLIPCIKSLLACNTKNGFWFLTLPWMILHSVRLFLNYQLHIWLSRQRTECRKCSMWWWWINTNRSFKKTTCFQKGPELLWQGPNHATEKRELKFKWPS